MCYLNNRQLNFLGQLWDVGRDCYDEKWSGQGCCPEEKKTNGLFLIFLPLVPGCNGLAKAAAVKEGEEKKTNGLPLDSRWNV